MVKIVDSTYTKSDHEHVSANTIQLNTEDINQLLCILKDFEHLFDGNILHWDTEPIDYELKSNSKPFNRYYYPVPRFNNGTFSKDLELLLKILLSNLVKQSQYCILVFIIPNKEGNVNFITD